MAEAAPLEGATEIERLRLNWKTVTDLAPADTKRTAALAILRSAGVHPKMIENDTVVLAFRQKFHKEQIEKADNLQIAERIIGSFLGRSCRINCIIEDNHLLDAALKMGARRIDAEER